MRVIAKQLLAEVQTISGWIVYVMLDDRPLEAEICQLDNLEYTIKKYKTKYQI